MKKKVKVCKYDVKTRKMEIVEEEMDFPDVEIKMYNPVEELQKKISNIEKTLPTVSTIKHSFGYKNFPKITSDSIMKLKFPSSFNTSIGQPIPAGVIKLSLHARVFGGHDNHYVKQPELKVFINDQQIFQAHSNSVEGDFSFNKLLLCNGGLLKIVASNTGKYIYFPNDGSYVAPYSSPSSPWLIYLEYSIKMLLL